MAMENKNWELFLKRAVHDIKDKVIKEEVREELLDHLEDRKERFMRFGDSEEEAEKKSLELMGDSFELKQKLGALHNRFYVGDLDSALLKIFTGFLFTFFNFNFFGLGVMSTVGTILIFAGCYQLRNINSTLKNAWRMTLVIVLWNLFTFTGNAVPAVLDFMSSNQIFFVMIGSGISTVRTVLLFAGINTLGKCALAGENLATPSLTKASVFFVITRVISFLAFSDADLAIYFVILMIPMYIYILYVLWGTRKTIALVEYRTESIDLFAGKGAKILATICAVFVVSVLSSSLIVATPKIESKPYISETSAEVNNMRQALVAKGFPSNVAERLPDEEIKKCFPLNPDGKVLVSENKMGMKDEPTVYVIAVPIESEDDDVARYIQAFVYSDKKNIRGYRDSIISEDARFPDKGSDSCGIFYKKDGVLYKEEPLKLFHTGMGVINGMEFRTVKGADEMYGYVAATGYLPKENKNHLTSYCNQKYFFNIPYSNVLNEFSQRNSSINDVLMQEYTYSMSRYACTSDTFWPVGGYYQMFDWKKDIITDNTK